MAQQPVPATGRWLARDTRPIGNLTAAQRAEAMATPDRIGRILRRLPELANPDGFEILPILAGGSQQLGPGVKGEVVPGSVVEYSLSLMHFSPTRAIAGEGRSCIVVTVNKTSTGMLHDAQGRAIYIEGDRAKPSTNPNISDGRVPHATQVYGELWNTPNERSFADVVFVTAGELPWKPVTREEFYQATLFDQEGGNGEKLAGVREAPSKTPYQQWMEAAEQRRRDREQTLKELTGILPPGEVAKMRQTMEATEREVTETLRKSEAEHRAQNAEGLANPLPDATLSFPSLQA